ncbi:MAG TPA: hypothetical protein VID67_12885 [Rhizomicrobium sp.]|jgi:hypothetical protein
MADALAIFSTEGLSPISSADISFSSPLKRWTVLVNGDIPQSTFDRLRNHPRYREISRRFMSETLALAATDRRVDSIFKDMGRYGAAVWSLYLHFTGGLTLPRLKEICARSKLLSPGRARALLIYLQLIGYVKAAPKTAGGITRYIPNPALVAALKAQALFGLKALAVVDPNFEPVVDHIDEPEVFRTLMVKFGEGAINTSVAVDQSSPFMTIFTMRNAGMQLLHLMLLADVEPDQKPPAQRIKLSIAAAAKQLNVARSHIARILNLAEKAKLLTRLEDGSMELSEELRRDADLVLCLQIVGYAICAAHAYEQIPASRR